MGSLVECFFGAAFCKAIFKALDVILSPLGIHLGTFLGVFLQLLAYRYFFENRAPVRARASKSESQGH